MDTAKATKLTDGVVKNIDAKAGHVTLKHGAIENLNMGPMTMAFAVKDKLVLSNLKEGSKVKFAVENVEQEFDASKSDDAAYKKYQKDYFER